MIFFPIFIGPPNQPGFKLPLPDEEYEDYYSDVEIIEADGQGRSFSQDIPRDETSADQAGPRLPTRQDHAELVVPSPGHNDW